MEEWKIVIKDNYHDAIKESICFSYVETIHHESECETQTFFIYKGMQCIILEDAVTGVLPIVLDAFGAIFVGMNMHINMLKQSERKMKTITVDSSFVDFVHIKGKRGLIVLCECDIYTIGTECQLLDHIALNDMIDDYEVKSQNVIIKLYDGSHYIYC